ncbi:DUF4190 domain-containing protein [Nocardia sp. NPDC005978]|uniref:DUF4190 domain-containing protein n=1 Tax=Nocardia sp. NPDC005978 TaxID=3156725 RepID=UPI0033A7FAF0
MTSSPRPVSPSKPAQRKTNLLALTTLITGFFGFCCVPLLIGPLALLHIRQTGEKGSGMAVTGIFASAAWLVGLTLIT